MASATSDPAAWFRAPRFLLAMLEAPRALAEASTLLPSLPLLLSAPRGDGHPVLVLPGFLADDASTRLLRFYLRDRGYTLYGWRLGMNLGVGDGVVRLLGQRVEELHRESGRKVSLVGWSLGGVIAREIARANPDVVRQVISLGSPIAPSQPPPVPCTAIYTRTDGVVPWETCRELDAPMTENIAVPGSHVGLGFNALVLYALADRLAQGEGTWKRFERTRFRELVYRQ